MNERDMTSTAPMVYPACKDGPCRGGTRICPTPQACQLTERAMPRHLSWLFALSRLFGRK